LVEVRFLPSNKVVQVALGTSILEASMAADVQMESACGGKGTCGKCKVQIVSGNMASPAPVEKKVLSTAQLGDGWVLACQRTLFEDTTVRAGEHEEVHDRKLGLTENARIEKLMPSIRKYPLVLQEPTIDDQTPDWERLLSALPMTGIRFSNSVAATLPKILRSANFRVTAVIDHDRILAVEPGDTSNRCFGLAADIGTTTIVVHLIDLTDGVTLASGAATNPQQGLGADVIARISHAASGPEGLRQLQERVISCINGIVVKLGKTAQVSSEEIYQMTVVGNTTMSHLFLGIDPTYLGPAPFIPVLRQEVDVQARELGLNTLRTGRVVILPNVAGYVGSDTVGVMLAARVDHLQGINLLVDIGTNAEVVLAGKERILTCSTAAGPAFEGAGIKCGMRAADGAVEGIRIAIDVELTIIGGGKPRGICGSGLIDGIAEMLRAGVMDASGRLASTDAQLAKLQPELRDRLRESTGGREFVLVWGKDSATGEDIVIHQKDVREVQLAKGAIMAGTRILMAKMGVEPEDIDQVFLAGAFGNYIKKEAALAIGLIPPIPLGRIKSIGNAAGDGAKMALLSAAERERAVTLAKRAEHIELSIVKEFQSQFVKSLAF
jgi:uncharacterized 2Fe-2S/4Fe-4S cluster protein (DUF4445 family)